MTGIGEAAAERPTPDLRRWRIGHVAVTGSTNADLAAAAASGAPDGTVLVADEQTAGRGRLGRRWQAPAGSSLIFSALVRPVAVPVSRRGWVGAILGLAIVEAIGTVAGVRPTLKWPNDILIGEAKLAGILAELVEDGVVVGSGINLTQTAAQLPTESATSLALSGAPGVVGIDLLDRILEQFGTLLAEWESAGGDVTAGRADSPVTAARAGGGILNRYRRHLATLGSTVTVQLPGDRRITGIARDVGADGRLVVVGDDGMTHRFAAGDVVHLRRERSTSAHRPTEVRAERSRSTSGDRVGSRGVTGRG